MNMILFCFKNLLKSSFFSLLPLAILTVTSTGFAQRADQEPAQDEREAKNRQVLTELNDLMKQVKLEERNQAALEEALSKFKQYLADEENESDDRRWVTIELGITQTLQKLKRFEEAESRLEPQIETYASKPTGGPRRVFLQRLFGNNYAEWAKSIAPVTVSYDSLPPETQKKILSLYTKAFRADPENILVLQSLARLALSTGEIAEQAKAVYDPTKDIDAPSSVLNQLGNHMLVNKEFDKAIRYYELAKEKSPRDPAILNNLAFSYLVAPDASPKRALQLIDEAIQNLPKGIEEKERVKFFHTKAVALKQMNRVKEALPLFEKSVKARPNHVDSLRAVIECHEALDLQPPEQYVERLAKIEAQRGN